MKKTIVFDFDGVIHSYKSGWKGDDIIPDPPVPGIRDAIQQLRDDGYEVHVLSTRCASPEGLAAMSAWMNKHGIVVDFFDKVKPPALVYVDDRAICFDGDSEGLVDKIRKFKPWHQLPQLAKPSGGGITSSQDK